MLAVKNHGSEWDTLIDNKEYLRYFVISEYWTLLGAGALHIVSLFISVYLGFMFKRIANMPPDMNPLESNLTSRMHKRNKSSVTTVSNDSVYRLSHPLEGHRSSGAPYETLSRPPSVPFMHTRQNSGDSFISSKRDSRSDLPSRQYQIPVGNTSRHSVATFATAKTQSPSRGSAHRGNYSEIPLNETGSPQHRSSGRPKSMAAASVSRQPVDASPSRVAKFTESWYTSDSLLGRTQQRQRDTDTTEREKEQQDNHRNRAYESLTQRYDNQKGGDGYSDDENNLSDRDHDMMRPDDISDMEDDGSEYSRRQGDSPINAYARMSAHDAIVHPLRSHPTKTMASPTSKQTPLSRSMRDSDVSALSEVDLNSRRVSGGDAGQDTTDAKSSYSALSIGKRYSQRLLGKSANSKSNLSLQKDRTSSIQGDGDFFSASKPYGELRPGTPPVIISVDSKGNLAGAAASAATGGRQVSSGNDFDVGGGNGRGYRRHVSGRAAEEGMAGTNTTNNNKAAPARPYSRYSILSD